MQKEVSHAHTCTACGAEFLCFLPLENEDCSGVDGDGRCPPCAERAFDAIGTDWRYF